MLPRFLPLFFIAFISLVSFNLYAEELASATAQTEPAEPFKTERENYKKLLDTKYTLFPHRGTYIMPVVYNTVPHEDIYQGLKTANPGEQGDVYKNTEAEFQVSFLLPIERNLLNTDFDLNFAYTHHAWWQVYNSDWSRPFRETNYQPEIFLRHLNPGAGKILGFDLIGYDAGYMHQSNGQIQILSRSWDRFFGRAVLQHSRFIVMLSGWVRIPEKENQDDNPDIEKYLGHGNIEIHRAFGKHSLSIQAPIGAEYWGVDVKYSYPSKDRYRWFLNIKHGYGHSLIEYNRPTEKYGIGISLDNIMDRNED